MLNAYSFINFLFLNFYFQQFVTCDHWIHLDIAGVMENSDEVPYLGSGMSGRPTRTIVKMMELMANGEF